MKMSVDQALRKARSLPADEAVAIYREMLERFPANRRVRQELESLIRPAIRNAPGAELDRIAALYQQRRVGEALDRAADLLARFPDCEILNNIAGAICAALGHRDHALFHYDRAIRLAPDYFEAHNNRGVVLNDAGRYDEAIGSFDTAIALHPNNPEAYMNRGIALRRLRRLDAALASVSAAIGLDPGSAEGHNNRGNILVDLTRFDEALDAFDRVIALRPGFAEAFVNRGNALLGLQRFEEAVASYGQAIALAPGQINAYNNSGSVLRRLKRFDEALACHRRALELDPGSALAQAEIRNLEAHMCLWREDGSDLDPVLLGTGDQVFPPFYMLNFEDSPERQLLCARNWAAAKYGPGRVVDFGARPASDRIRVGYFSADFHNHATMYLMARMFELHDRSRFEIHAFSYGPQIDDDMRRRVMAGVDHFHAVGPLSDEDVAALARAEGLDIAVDLKGHTENARPGIFAQRAAPAQAHLLGFPGTSGTDFIDYIIVDRTIVPPEHQAFFTETLAYLPNSYYPTDDQCRISDRQFTRAELGLPEDGFVFCSFNNSYKIKRPEFDIWMRLLDRVPGSVIWLLGDNAWAVANLRAQAEARGIATDRLVFAERMPLADHLARHRHADLLLDTFMVNAHTTATDALWAGLPVLTMRGNSFVASVAASVLQGLDMPELITATPDAYEARALEIATDPALLAALKAKVARNRTTTSLFDSARYTRDVETLFEQMVSARRSS